MSMKGNSRKVRNASFGLSIWWDLDILRDKLIPPFTSILSDRGNGVACQRR